MLIIKESNRIGKEIIRKEYSAVIKIIKNIITIIEYEQGKIENWIGSEKNNKIK